VAKTSPLEDAVCVHCGKPFHAEVLSPKSEQAGVKCPHCKLFMPLGRVEENGAA
jgi:hypothetical protein